MGLYYNDTGNVKVTHHISGVGMLVERFYPLCGDAVQTEIRATGGEVHVRPDTYTQRAVLSTDHTCPECGGSITNEAHPCVNGMQCEDCPYIGPGRRG